MHVSKYPIAVASLVLFGAAISATSPAMAQMSAMPPEVGEKIRALGPGVINPPAVAPIYAPFQEKEPYASIKVMRDVKYGPADRNLADNFVPEGASGRPVLIYVHGGGFTRGERHFPPTGPFDDHVAVWAARNGFIGVNITYRLAPASTWPAGAEDVGLAVRFVKDTIKAQGGDPQRIFLMGHSAGAVHVASYLGHSEFWGGSDVGLSGAVILSGEFDLTTMTAGEPEKIYFGSDPSKYAERSALAGLLKLKLPLLIAYAEYDPPFFIQQANQINDALCKEGRCPRFLMLKGHSHMSELMSINTKDVELTNAILDLVKTANAAKM